MYLVEEDSEKFPHLDIGKSSFSLDGPPVYDTLICETYILNAFN